MKSLDLYKEILAISTLEDIIKAFIDSLSDPQRTFNYFVDRKKIYQNIERLKIEINILNSLVGSTNVEKEIKGILVKYPEVLPIFPLIIAVRNQNVKISDFDSLKIFSFKKRKLLPNEIDSIIEFCNKTGIINIFSEIKNLKDYLMGIEIGMDTNARKNRSGATMELMLAEPLEKLSKQYCFKLYSQKQFKLFEKFGYPYPKSLKERKFDFALISDNNWINIETNIYGETGSKPQEIVDAYINRQKDLNAAGWTLIWITDGNGWKGQENQLRKGFQEIDYILNLNFVKKGLMERLIKNIIL